MLIQTRIIVIPNLQLDTLAVAKLFKNFSRKNETCPTRYDSTRDDYYSAF